MVCGNEHRMVRFFGREGERGLDIFRFEVREIGEDLRLGHAGRQKVKDVPDPDAHAADARATAALLGIEGDPVHSRHVVIGSLLVKLIGNGCRG
jgi:hypothetical protein